jgi:hypothetical protein
MPDESTESCEAPASTNRDRRGGEIGEFLSK